MTLIIGQTRTAIAEAIAQVEEDIVMVKADIAEREAAVAQIQQLVAEAKTGVKAQQAILAGLRRALKVVDGQ